MDVGRSEIEEGPRPKGRLGYGRSMDSQWQALGRCLQMLTDLERRVKAEGRD